MTQMKITISGLAGSGKTTIGKLLAEELQTRFVSAGEFSRKFAMDEFKMDINEFQAHCLLHPEVDEQIDKKMISFCNEQDMLVIDYRLGPKFINNALHVFLKVSPEEAHKRISASERINEKTTMQDINLRNEQMRARFIRNYAFDFTAEDNYKLIIDTETNKPEQIIKIILNKLNSHRYEE